MSGPGGGDAGTSPPVRHGPVVLYQAGGPAIASACTGEALLATGGNRCSPAGSPVSRIHEVATVQAQLDALAGVLEPERKRQIGTEAT